MRNQCRTRKCDSKESVRGYELCTPCECAQIELLEKIVTFVCQKLYITDYDTQEEIFFEWRRFFMDNPKVKNLWDDAHEKKGKEHAETTNNQTTTERNSTMEKKSKL